MLYVQMLAQSICFSASLCKCWRYGSDCKHSCCNGIHRVFAQALHGRNSCPDFLSVSRAEIQCCREGDAFLTGMDPAVQRLMLTPEYSGLAILLHASSRVVAAVVQSCPKLGCQGLAAFCPSRAHSHNSGLHFRSALEPRFNASSRPPGCEDEVCAVYGAVQGAAALLVGDWGSCLGCLSRLDLLRDGNKPSDVTEQGHDVIQGNTSFPLHRKTIRTRASKVRPSLQLASLSSTPLLVWTLTFLCSTITF